MLQAVLDHLVCPDTLDHLDVDVVDKNAEEVVAATLSSRSKKGGSFALRDGIPDFVSDEVALTQTVQSFSQKWAKHNYYREHTRKFYTDWYLQRYGFGELSNLQSFLSDTQFILDAGTGSGRDAANFAELSNATVFGADTARSALEMARKDVKHPRVSFVQADLNRLPFSDNFFDFINCDQVIHHTADPRKTFESLRRKLKPGGQICCYVYKKKAVVREFVDDYVRERVSNLPIDEATRLCEGFTKLGQVLAKLDIDVEIEEDIPVLGIKKGKQNLQRFFHWNIMKCFWNDDFDYFTNNIINFDWYHPQFCYRYEPEEFRAWFDTGWDIQAWDVQDAGISCRAKKV